MPEHPAFFVFHPLKKELPEWIDGWFAGKAIINVLIICVCFEPKFIGVTDE